MNRAPTRAEQAYLAAAGLASDPAADELARVLYEIEANPHQLAAELLKLRALRRACQAKQRRLPESVQHALAAARPASIVDFLGNYILKSLDKRKGLIYHTVMGSPIPNDRRWK